MMSRKPVLQASSYIYRNIIQNNCIYRKEGGYTKGKERAQAQRRAKTRPWRSETMERVW